MKKEVVIAFLFLLLLASALALGCRQTAQTTIIGNSIKSDAKNTTECAANICIKGDKEVYCPYTLTKCEVKYSSCKRVLCDDGQPVEIQEAETVSYPVEDAGASDAPGCTEGYNDCYDNGELITCKGSFSDCSATFQDCKCGSTDYSAGQESDEANPTFDSTAQEECGTGVYVCQKNGYAMDGTPTVSRVTCRGSITQCSLVYGACACGNTSLVDFPTTVLGEQVDAPVQTMCDFYGEQVPCTEIDPACNEKKSRCKDGEKWIICEGSFAYCNGRYGSMCLCGLEQKGYS